MLAFVYSVFLSVSVEEKTKASPNAPRLYKRYNYCSCGISVHAGDLGPWARLQVLQNSVRSLLDAHVKK